MSIHVRDATPDDAPLLARLRSAWDLDRHGRPADTDFAARLADWMRTHPGHRAALALDTSVEPAEPVGMAWLAIAERVPRVDAFDRAAGDIQSVFVAPEHRGRGVGSALIAHLTAIAEQLGLAFVGVHSSTEGIPLYRSAGFASSPKMMRRPAEAAR